MGVRTCLKATPMTDVTRILSAIEQGDLSAAEQLLPLVYDELRKLAAQKMAKEKPDPGRDRPRASRASRGVHKGNSIQNTQTSRNLVWR